MIVAPEILKKLTIENISEKEKYDSMERIRGISSSGTY